MSGEGRRVERADEAVRGMSTTSPQKQAQPKAPDSGKVSHGSKDHEIENLKRLLADVSKRLDKLK